MQQFLELSQQHFGREVQFRGGAKDTLLTVYAQAKNEEKKFLIFLSFFCDEG